MSAFKTVEFYQMDAEPLVYAKGDVIFEPGEIGTEMFAVLKGSVGLWVNGRLLEEFQAGDVFGEGAIVQLDSTRASRAIASTDCELMNMDEKRFLFACQTTPMFAIEVMRSFSDRLRALKQKLADGAIS